MKNLSKPALILGLIALIGLIALRQTASGVISGTLKSIIGYLILSGGAGIIIGTLVSGLNHRVDQAQHSAGCSAFVKVAVASFA